MTDVILLIPGCVVGYGAAAGVTHALLVAVYPPLPVPEFCPSDNRNRKELRYLGAVLWPLCVFLLCVLGAASCGNLATSRLLNARKPRAKLFEVRRVFK